MADLDDGFTSDLSLIPPDYSKVMSSPVITFIGMFSIMREFL